MAARRKSALRFLITAGPTREYIDPVRYLSNASSGAMGVALADAARRAGHVVTLVLGPVALPPPRGVDVVQVTSAAEMAAACIVRWPGNDVLIAAAAVADYAPTRFERHKIKKSPDARTLPLRPTIDILKTLAAMRRDDQRVIGFALEDRDARARAESKLASKWLDAIVLNTPDAIDAASSRLAVLMRDGGWRELGSLPKRNSAREIVRIAARLALLRIE